MNTLKKCFKCGTEQPRCEFYRHPQMADGHLGKCKECTKADVRTRAFVKRDEILKYERQRAMLPHRVEQRREYARSSMGRAAQSKSCRQYHEKNPQKKEAHWLTSNAIRDGRLIRKPCEVCGVVKVQAHHEDYSKPLEVVWLCVKHHRERHKR